MSKAFRITLWSGGKPVSVHYIKEAPQMAEGIVAYKTDDGNAVRLMGTISIEQGDFTERPITGVRR
ncbi:MAG: hypothetical protein AAB353_07425 [Candidatus Hydrogenedentota bacterium]